MCTMNLTAKGNSTAYAPLPQHRHPSPGDLEDHAVFIGEAKEKGANDHPHTTPRHGPAQDRRPRATDLTRDTVPENQLKTRLP